MFVTNASQRPISAITCKDMPSTTRKAVAYPEKSGLIVPDPDLPPTAPPKTWVYVTTDRTFPRLRPGDRCGFSFKNYPRRGGPDVVFVAWFTDDAGFKWQLDEYLHLAQVPDDDDQIEYRPL